ncbi:hypothetical protein BBJ28_00008206 [Nothophytophthora sp. Chile5]|nr:hypothetical protein BBJ28_00008206 [Nothophytophthora sp. Chile5]
MIDAVFLLEGPAHNEEQACKGNNGSSCVHSMAKEQVERIAELLAASQAATHCTISTVEVIQHERADGIKEELTAVAQINETLVSHNLPRVCSADRTRLGELIVGVRQQEQQLEFHRGLLQAQRKEGSSPNSKYSPENFAYGSTPFPTWLHLFTQDAMRDAIIASPQQTQLTVFGSSTGSLVFFAALALGISCLGVELLPFLHDIAEQTRKELRIPAERCRFECADMLTTPLGATKILLLTSQCWDPELYDQLQCKLERELLPGTLVIDYKNTLQRSPSFRVVEHVEQQRVSWTGAQSLFILERL